MLYRIHVSKLNFQINEDGDASLHYWIGAFANEVLIADSNSLRNKNEDIGLQTFNFLAILHVKRLLICYHFLKNRTTKQL